MEHSNTETRRLRSWVHLPGPSGEYVGFGPDDHPLPDWAIEALADNPRVWRSDDNEPEVPQPTAPTMIGHEFEPGSLVSGPMTTTSGQRPSSPSPGASRRGPSGSPGTEAARGIAEAERRFGTPPPGDAA